jgi:hypothetical protein
MNNNRVNIDSNIWGPKAWFFLDYSVLSFPENPTKADKDGFRNFLTSLKIVLPCQKCRNHFTEYITKNPLTDDILSSKKKLVDWILACHNNVRSIQNKPLLSIDDFYNYYSKQSNLENNKETNILKNYLTNKNISYVLIIIIFILVVMLIVTKN